MEPFGWLQTSPVHEACSCLLLRAAGKKEVDNIPSVSEKRTQTKWLRNKNNVPKKGVLFGFSFTEPHRTVLNHQGHLSLSIVPGRQKWPLAELVFLKFQSMSLSIRTLQIQSHGCPGMKIQKASVII